MSHIPKITILAALIGAPAYAGGLTPVTTPEPVVVAPVAPVFDWTGPYVGAQLGWGWASIVESGDPDIDGDGFVAGVHAGYNYDFGNIVAGIELAYNLANIEFENGDPDDTIDTLSNLKLRVGYDTGRTWFYLAGGIARAEAAGGASGSGNVLGLGVEQRFSQRWSGGVEYLRYNFDDFYSGGINLEAQTLQARVSYRF